MKSTFDELKAQLKAELKAEVMTELAAQFDRELQLLRKDVEDLRAVLRVPPKDDETEIEDAALHRFQDEGSDKAKQDYTTWRGFESCFQQQSVKILRGSWLLEWNNQGRRVERRQELPEEAFCLPEEALTQIKLRADLMDQAKFLFVLSYRWLQPEHPDPHRHHLTIVCRILSLAIDAFGDVGLFWDFLSLCQRNDDDVRTEQEQESFNRGLKAANLLYAHRLSVVVVQPVLPLHFTGPSYEWSGWCHFESVVSNLIKPWDQRLNVQLSRGDEKSYNALRDNCKVSRNPPVSPGNFKAQLDKRIFTNGHSDAKIVVKLYISTFFALADTAENLDFSNLLWCLPQAKVLSRALPEFAKCNFLDVSRNPFGAHGVVVLMDGVAQMRQLRTLVMRCCRGLEVAAKVSLWSQKLERMNLKCLDLTENAFDASSLKMLARYGHFSLKVDGSDFELRNAGFSAQQRKEQGRDAKQLKDAGYSLQHLKDAGFVLQELKRVEFSASELKAAGSSVTELKHAGFSLQELKEAGATASELKHAGFSLGVLVKAGLSARELKNAGFSLTELKGVGVSARRLKDAGFCLQELMNVRFEGQVLKNVGFSAREFMDAGSSLQELKKLGFGARELRDVGFGLLSLMDVGFAAWELKEAGFTPNQLLQAGFTIFEVDEFFPSARRPSGARRM